MPALNQYEEDDFEQILKLAAQKSFPSNFANSRARLESMAAELGITPEALAEAELEYEEKKERLRDREIWERERKSGLVGHLIPYIAVNAFLAFISLKQGEFWFLYVLLGWGIGMVSHLYCALNNGPAAQEDFERWRENRRRIQNLDHTYGAQRILEEYVTPYKLEYRPADKIGAIKHLRELTGMGLREAKEYVEHHASKNPGSIL